jgi:hypothetical protein
MRGTVPVATENTNQSSRLSACCWEDAMGAQRAMLGASGDADTVKVTNQKAGKLPGWSEAGSDKAIAERRALANRRAKHRASIAELQRKSGL